MAKLIDTLLLPLLLLLIPLLHLSVSPSTKVEESFNMQATHDILVYGVPLLAPARLRRTYDHFAFPGAVPRSFLGAVLLAGASQPVVWVLGFGRAQAVVRTVLMLFNGWCLVVFGSRLRAAFGTGVGRWWVVFLASQFHVSYYLSRTLPNMFAFGLTTLAAAFLLPSPSSSPRHSALSLKKSIALLTISAAIFRSEIALLLTTTTAYLLLTRRATLRAIVPAFLAAFVAALVVSVPIDSFFWQRPLWPELWGFYYNAVLGSSSNWGVSPWHYYFTSALPRLLLNPLLFPLIVLALAQPGTSRAARALLVPNLAFIAIYSLQPHKEARFIFYTIPSLTAAAALGADFLSSRLSKSIIYSCATAVLVLSVLVAFAASTAMLLISSLNYPGGDALAQLYALAPVQGPPPALVHADVLTCMTGLTLFGQNPTGYPVALSLPPDSGATPPRLIFDKTEDSPQLKWPTFWNAFDYVLAEDPSKVLGNWEVVGVVQGYDGIEILNKLGNEPANSDEPVLGLGAKIATLRDHVPRYTGGWWVGPRMSPRIHILKKVNQEAHV